MRTANTIALTLTVFLFFGKPTFAENGFFAPKDAADWAMLIIACLVVPVSLFGLYLLFTGIYIIIRGHYYNQGIINELNQSYESLSPNEQAKIKGLEMKTEEAL